MYIQTIVLTALAGFTTAGPIEARQFGSFGSGLGSGGLSSGGLSSGGLSSGGLGSGGLSSGGLSGLGGTGTTSKEFSQGGCRDILFAFARGSTEIGNMGSVVGPPTSNGLKQAFGSNAVATEGIDYAASIGTNALPGGTDAASKKLMQTTLINMAQKCPNSVIVTSGYSQGAAVNHRAIEELDAAVKEQIAGVVLYGDTQKTQDRNQIPNFPANKVKIICQTGDMVCTGTLVVMPAHLTYGSRVNEGVQFLTQQIKSTQAKIKARNAKRAAEEMAAGLVAKVEKVAMPLVV